MNDYVKRLRRLDACAVSDALDKLGLEGAVSGLAQYSGNASIAGKVMTFRMVAQAEAAPPSGAPRHLGTTAIELAESGDVLVAEQRTGLEAACWGGILTLGAKLKGLAGVIAEGLVRDIDEAITYEFPIFARGVTARTARGRIAEAETGGTIHVGQIRVRAGDYVVADRSGVVFVSAAKVAEVLEVAETIFLREAAMAKALLNGDHIIDVMGASYEHMLHSSSGKNAKVKE
ncbi:RraA family protein [Eoetvoesiella caeni]|uniref:Putative 4-hydroxy-4-methyl-2-oxoglutarate aldolase n=1 Tax=Eoetvoesiella caeni TaxID=645616 RepID=A0A366H0R2_9BURK|nr:RraA family protein [Eoetvoesiella caeni]MCI2810971.1 RraA family protein [Eoetvoesiella caeni]NYT56870.1 RraA family protein [Eoetvoesiella caeni]RBP35437.1 regulator of RNase E activity RraA [Eoetvoesiella caeni]